jgi:hypothetical protein
MNLVFSLPQPGSEYVKQKKNKKNNNNKKSSCKDHVYKKKKY